MKKKIKYSFERIKMMLNERLSLEAHGPDFKTEPLVRHTVVNWIEIGQR